MPHFSRIILLPLALVVPFVSGCMTTAHLLSAATTSPGKKNCGLHVVVEEIATEQNSIAIQIKGGFSGHEKEMNLTAGIREKGYSGERWIINGYGNYWREDRSCFPSSPIQITLDDGIQKRSGKISVEDIGTKDVFGNYYLTLRGAEAELILYENLGKTKYGAASMSMGWDLEPPRVVARVQLQLIKEKSER
jgi:hypothetical protein